MSYIISCCSIVDLTKEHLKKINVSCISYHYVLDGKEYVDDFGQTMPIKDFYQKMRDGASTSTSQISIGEYEDHFKKLLDSGKDVIHVCLSSGISGTFKSATAAAENLRGSYSNQKLYVIDSLCASSGCGLLVDMMVEKRDRGMSIDELYVWTNKHKKDIQHWFFSTDLTYYVRGGRVSKVSGVIGGIFEICPLLNVNDEGKLIPISKIRTKKRVIAELVKKAEQHAIGGLNYDGKFYISHSDCLEDAMTLKEMIEERFKHINSDVSIYDIGTTIGCHSGPGTVALFFVGDRREG